MPRRKPPRILSAEKNAEMVASAASRLAEHNDSVLVITTRDIDGTTSTCVTIKGNCYAARDSARQWLNVASERERQWVRRDIEDS